MVTLNERQEALTALDDKFLDKAVNNPTFWTEMVSQKGRNEYNTRQEAVYREYKCNTERCRNNSLN